MAPPAAAQPAAEAAALSAAAPGEIPDRLLARLPPKEKLEADYQAAAAAAAGTLHQDVLDAQDWDILTLFLLLRLGLAFCVRTFFQPDEYFQALEPAWQLAFGPASGAWITWEWREHLRTSLHPVLFAGVYSAVESFFGLLQIAGPLRATALVLAPRLVQASFTALGDYYIWRLSGHLYGPDSNTNWAAVWLAVTSPWQAYCGARTFSNGLEATLTVAALSYWPWQLLSGPVDDSPSVAFAGGGIRRLRVSLLLAATAVVLRPTNVLIWLALLTVTVSRVMLDLPPLSSAVVVRLLAESIGCGSAVLGVSAVSDRLFYGAWTLPAYTFLDINLTQDVAVFYGRNPWHYYLTQGLPLLTMAALPFVVSAVYSSLVLDWNGPAPAATRGPRKALAFMVAATVAALSLVAHKEVRFLHPLFPILCVLAAPHAAAFFTTIRIVVKKGKKPGTDEFLGFRRKQLLGLAFFVHLVMTVYLARFHQQAPIAALRFLRAEYERIHYDWIELRPDDVPAPEVYPDAFFVSPHDRPWASDGDGDELFALFLMPCHSTPWRSHLVYPGLRARALTCEPPLGTAPRSAERAAYLDEADRFYAALAAGDTDGSVNETETEKEARLSKQSHFLATELWPLLKPDDAERAGTQAGGRRRAGEVPRYIVGFEGIEPLLTHFFGSHDPVTGGADLGVEVPMRRAWVGFNGYVNDDWRRQGLMVVWDTGVYSGDSHPDAVKTVEGW